MKMYAQDEWLPSWTRVVLLLPTGHRVPLGEESYAESVAKRLRLAGVPTCSCREGRSLSPPPVAPDERGVLRVVPGPQEERTCALCEGRSYRVLRVTDKRERRDKVLDRLDAVFADALYEQS